jgi:hypothetical protein
MEEQLSCFQKTARLRWPYKTVVGDGPLVVVCGCRGIVHLFELPIETGSAIQPGCDPKLHQTFRLVKPASPRPYRSKRLAEMED